MLKIIDLFTPEQEGILKDEIFATTKTGFDFVQWGMAKFTENPLKAAGIIALVMMALFGKNLKLGEVVDLKKK